MYQFKIQKTGESLTSVFNEQIKLALQKIKEENNLSGFEHKIIKDDIQHAINFGQELYSGNYMIFEILNYSLSIGKLHCFISSDKTFINIMAI